MTKKEAYNFIKDLKKFNLGLSEKINSDERVHLEVITTHINSTPIQDDEVVIELTDEKLLSIVKLFSDEKIKMNSSSEILGKLFDLDKKRKALKRNVVNFSDKEIAILHEFFEGIRDKETINSLIQSEDLGKVAKKIQKLKEKGEIK